MQDDDMVVTEEEEAKVIVMEVKALDEGAGCTILIEHLLNPVLINPPPVL
jgi:hypothetical protein